MQLKNRNDFLMESEDQLKNEFNNTRKKILTKLIELLEDFNIKPLGHPDYLGYTDSLILKSSISELPIVITLNGDNSKLILYTDNGDQVTSLNNFSTEDLYTSIKNIKNYITK